MASFALIGLVIYTVASGIVGVRLLLRARRSHGLPELLAGLSYIGAPAIGYPLSIVSSQLSNRAVATPLYLTGETCLVFGCCCFLFFTVKVFRPGAFWAVAAAALGSGVFVWSGVRIIHAFLIHTDAAEIAAHARIPVAGMVGVLMLSYVWTALEGFRYYRMMRKRMALGMADAVVTNRFLLWTFSGLTSVAWISVSAVMLASGANLGTNMVNIGSTCLGGLANTVFLVLIFMPPTSYTRWVQRSAHAPQLATV
ncbi:MAG TPA: hypothetical protein VMR50_17860 [Myxococcota bacterium]|nr:hypothetical protein [Myxococcota bacterium]